MENKYINKSFLILQSLNKSIDSFYDLYNNLEKGKEEQKQDLLRAVMVFSCSGIDAIVKQLIRDALKNVIEHDEGALIRFKSYTEKKLIQKNEVGINSSLLAELFTCDNPKEVLIESMKKDLTSNSLQSSDELLKIGSYFNIETSKLVKDKNEHELLKKVFFVRNQMIHEMDVNMDSEEFELRKRTKTEIEKYSKFIIELAEKFINLVEEKTSEEEAKIDIDQFISL